MPSSSCCGYWVLGGWVARVLAPYTKRENRGEKGREKKEDIRGVERKKYK